MARPMKEDAEWFPFYAKDGRTLTILQHRFGLAGIGFFTNVMRLLALTPRHHLNVSDEIDRVYTYSKIGCEPEDAEEMITTMVMTGKFDRVLWEEAGVLYSPDLTESLSCLYESRSKKPPTADELQKEYLGVSSEKTHVSREKTPVSSQEMPSEDHPEGVSRVSNPTQTGQIGQTVNTGQEMVRVDFQSWLTKKAAGMPNIRNPGGFVHAVLNNPKNPEYAGLRAEYERECPEPESEPPPRPDPGPPPPKQCDACGSDRVFAGGQDGEAVCRTCGRFWTLTNGEWIPDPDTGKPPPEDDDFETYQESGKPPVGDDFPDDPDNFPGYEDSG